MPFGDGATTARKQLASSAGVTDAVAMTMSGADLEFARLQRDAAGSTGLSGADLTQRGARANIIGTGELNYAAAGGKVTRIIGKNFTGATGIKAGVSSFTAFSVIDDETVQGTTPAKAAGSWDLTVSHPDGDAVKVAGITYI